MDRATSTNAPDHRKVQRARTPWGVAVREMLADGEWHEQAELTAAGIRMVPPSVAYRRGERLRRAGGGSSGPGPEVRQVGDHHDSVAVGGRRVVLDVLRAAVYSGVVERDGDRYRLAREAAYYDRQVVSDLVVSAIQAGPGRTHLALAEHLGLARSTATSWANRRATPSHEYWPAIEQFFGWEVGTIAELARRSRAPR